MTGMIRIQYELILHILYAKLCKILNDELIFLFAQILFWQDMEIPPCLSYTHTSWV